MSCKHKEELELLKIRLGMLSIIAELSDDKTKRQIRWFSSLHRKEKRRILAKGTFDHEYMMWCDEQDAKHFENALW